MKIMIFDTETTSLNKPFCYNIGYTIVETENGCIEEQKDFVVEQIWHNLPLFSTAYYADKRQIYVKAMKSKKMVMKKFGYICQEMIRDIKRYNIDYAYAFNSGFDEKVFNFNCDWFKCNNPFDDVNILDIRGFAHHFITNHSYKSFCEEHNLFTDSGNYSTTAETYYQFLTNDIDFTESHTALSDSIIETFILMVCKEEGANLTEDYKAYASIPREQEKELTIIDNETKEILYSVKCKKYTVRKTKNQIVIK